ncbi:MAG: GNAT family N-acetyltransferase, partial [Mycobacteriales bacterium]
ARASGFLGFACVHPKSRGSGLGRALGQAVSTWAAEAGDAVVCTDWRSTNLSADRAWPALGYQTSFLRLHRNVGY